MIESGEQLDFNDEIEEKIKYKIENFEGPLDLLLFLIRGSKLDIKTIKLSEITEQYLEFMNQLTDLKMERASEFLEVAATLIEIKSKSLLPKPVIETEEEDSETTLLKRLEEYRLFKEQTEELKKQENLNRFYKEPEKSANDYRIILKDFSFDKLIDAFAKVLYKAEVKVEIPLPREIAKDRFTLAEKASAIIADLEKHEKVMFFDLFSADYSKSEVITTFMAILELLKCEQILVSQTEHYSDIEIRKNIESYNPNFSSDKFDDYNSTIEELKNGD